MIQILNWRGLGSKLAMTLGMIGSAFPAHAGEWIDVGLWPTNVGNFLPSIPAPGSVQECVGGAVTHAPNRDTRPESFPSVFAEVVARKRDIFSPLPARWQFRVMSNKSITQPSVGAGNLVFWQPRSASSSQPGWMSGMGPGGVAGSEIVLKEHSQLPSGIPFQSHLAWQDLDKLLLEKNTTRTATLPAVFMYRETQGSTHVLVRMAADPKACHYPLDRLINDPTRPLISHETIPELNQKLAFLPTYLDRKPDGTLAFTQSVKLRSGLAIAKVFAKYVPAVNPRTLGHADFETLEVTLPKDAQFTLWHLKVKGPTDFVWNEMGTITGLGTRSSVLDLKGLEPKDPQDWGSEQVPRYRVALVLAPVKPSVGTSTELPFTLVEYDQGGVGFIPTRGVVFPF